MISLTPCRLAVVVLLATDAASARLTAQQPADSTTREFCFRGAPLPRCRWFAVTEVGVAWLAVGTQPDPLFSDSRRRVAATWNLGVMYNLAPRTALGVALLFSGLDADESRAGVQVRYRRWLSSTTGLEGAVGLLFEANDVQSHFSMAPQLPGLTGEVRLEWRELLGLQVRIDRLRAGREQITDLWVGARAGGGVGGVGLAILAAVTLIGLATLDL